jgi:hypothetical protein
LEQFGRRPGVAAQIFSFFIGAIFLGLGICGFIPHLLTRAPSRLDWGHMVLSSGYGFEFGFLPTNLLHNLLYLVIGAAGILAVVSLKTAQGYNRALSVVAILMVFAGFAPWGIESLWGILPLFGWNILWHVVVAVLAWYFGFIYDPNDVPLAEMMERC